MAPLQSLIMGLQLEIKVLHPSQTHLIHPILMLAFTRTQISVEEETQQEATEHYQNYQLYLELVEDGHHSYHHRAQMENQSVKILTLHKVALTVDNLFLIFGSLVR